MPSVGIRGKRAWLLLRCALRFGEGRVGLVRELHHARQVVIAGEDLHLLGGMLEQPLEDRSSRAFDLDERAVEVEVIAHRHEPGVATQPAGRIEHVVTIEDGEKALRRRLRIARGEPSSRHDVTMRRLA